MIKKLNFIKAESYRKDIDGLRAIAVLSVIAYHFGLLPNGYLGVDVFFVISGFLITNIIYNESLEGEFSLKKFYIRRIRRIVPLVLFISIVSLILGTLTMLPDALENLAQSLIATNLFSNNILQAITTRNYWDIINDFKPMLHTWSLGIEEQYYLLYPFIFLFLSKKRIQWVLPILLILTIISIILFFLPFKSYEKFYYLPFRFYELSFGGIAAIILKKRLIDIHFSYIFIVVLLGLLLINVSIIPASISLCLTVIISCMILISANNNNISSFILKNKIFVWIGMASFSLYMWHQLVVSFTRYFFIHTFSISLIIILIGLIFSLSTITYYFLEQPFRNKAKINVRKLFGILIPTFLFIMISSFYIYYKGGVLKDVPELDIYSSNRERGMHAQYNQKIHSLNKDFKTASKIKVLIYGDSFARDWANVLLASQYNNIIEISYTDVEQKMLSRQDSADIVFIALSKQRYENLHLLLGKLNVSKVWYVGIKNFGIDNGIFYNNRGNNYCFKRTFMENGYWESNETLKHQFKSKYINIIDYIIDENHTVPVFTPDCKFISQDCRHFTKAGANYFATLIENDSLFVLNNINILSFHIVENKQERNIVENEFATK